MQPQHLNFKPSRILALLLAAMGLSVSAILIVMPLLWYVKSGIFLWVFISVIYGIAKYALLSLPFSVIAFDISQQNKLDISYRNGQLMRDVSVCNDSVVTEYLTVIRLEQKNAPLLRRVFKTNILLMPDSLDAASYRRLRTWLRWGIKPI